jgi:transposase
LPFQQKVELVLAVDETGQTRRAGRLETALGIRYALAAQIEQLEAAVAAIEKQLMAWHKSNPVSQRLASVPGIGPIIATASRW